MKQYYLFIPKKFPERPLNLRQECLIYFDSALNNPDCISTTVAQAYPLLSKVFDHPLNDKTLKLCNTHASHHISSCELVFLTVQSPVFIAKKQYRYYTNAHSQSVSYAQVTSAANVCGNKYEIAQFNAQPTEFQKTFILIKQIEKSIEPYRANFSDLSDTEILRKFTGYHAA